jgi:hypothetical protein
MGVQIPAYRDRLRPYLVDAILHAGQPQTVRSRHPGMIAYAPDTGFSQQPYGGTGRRCHAG